MFCIYRDDTAGLLEIISSNHVAPMSISMAGKRVITSKFYTFIFPIPISQMLFSEFRGGAFKGKRRRDSMYWKALKSYDLVGNELHFVDYVKNDLIILKCNIVIFSSIFCCFRMLMVFAGMTKKRRELIMILNVCASYKFRTGEMRPKGSFTDLLLQPKRFLHCENSWFFSWCCRRSIG